MIIKDLLKSEGNRVLVVLIIGVFMAALDIAIVGPALPAIRSDFSIGDREIVWIFNIYILMYMIGTPLMAKLSEIFGRRSIYVLDVGLFALGSLIVILTPSFPGLLAGRAVQGFGAGGIFPVAIAFIASAFPPERRGRALGILGSIFGLSNIVGPVLGGLLLTFSWKLLFIINIPAAAAVTFMGLKVLPGSSREETKPFDWKGLVLLAIIVISLAYGINRIDTQRFAESISSITVWPLLLLSLILIPVFWIMERRSVDPIIRTRLFESRQLSLAGILALLAGMLQPALVFLPALAVLSLGLKIQVASLMVVPLVATMVAGTNITGFLLDKYGSKRVITIGGIILAIGIASLASEASNFWLFILSCAICGLGFPATAGAPLSYIVMGECRESERATSQGAVSLFSCIGMLVGAAVFGAVIASGGEGIAGYKTAYMSLVLIALIMAVLARGLKQRHEEIKTIMK